MIQLIDHGVFLANGKTIWVDRGPNGVQDIGGNPARPENIPPDLRNSKETARKNTISYRILMNHNTSGDETNLKIRFDALTSHDITFVGIIQTARASGLQAFPMPYVLTNCHNSLCAVGGTINEDDHLFGLTAAQKYGGVYVPAHQAVIHQYMREMMTRSGNMILGSDSHTRYGALGTMAIGEGGPELVKQLLERTYDVKYPEIMAVYLEGKLRPGVGPQDVAIALIGAVFKNGFVKNKILEFVGPGIENLSVDCRNGIDTMTTETACLSSVWATDEAVKDYYRLHGRPEAFSELQPGATAYYDGMVYINLDKVEPMIAFPFHPSNAFAISEFNRNPYDLLKTIEEDGKKQLENPNLQFCLSDKVVDGRLRVDQAIVAGCAGGTYQNLLEVAAILENRSIGDGALSFSVYPASQPIYLELVRNGAATKIMVAGATLKTAFCGPCFGAGDIPANGDLSIRHTTRNFPNREGSKPGDGQISSVALMDARSIAATAVNGGFLTPATEIGYPAYVSDYRFDAEVYSNRVYQGFGSPKPEQDLRFGPNIRDWPKMSALPDHLLLQVASVILDSVTTTDELIPSGETSSYRSNPLKLAEFTLSRKDPQYVNRAKAIQELEQERRALAAENAEEAGLRPAPERVKSVCEKIIREGKTPFQDIYDMLRNSGIGSCIYAVKPGDGSAREQAASSQKVLGGWANIAVDYATKRYRSNLINWGMLPFTLESGDAEPFLVDDYIFIPDIRKIVENGEETVPAQVYSSTGTRDIQLALKNLTADEREIILQGCLINYYNVR